MATNSQGFRTRHRMAAYAVPRAQVWPQLLHHVARTACWHPPFDIGDQVEMRL